MESAYKIDDRRYTEQNNPVYASLQNKRNFFGVYMYWANRGESEPSRRGESRARGEERDPRLSLASLSSLFAQSTQKYACSADYVYPTSVLYIKKQLPVHISSPTILIHCAMTKWMS